MEWADAFSELFRAFVKDFPKDTVDANYDPTKVYNSPVGMSYLEYEVINPTLNRHEAVVINGIKIEKGTILRLADRIGEDYKHTIHYDVHIKEPSWDLYESSDKDYQFVHLCHIENHFKEIFNIERRGSISVKKARRICGGFSSEIRYISEKDGKYFAYTDHFEIELQTALDNKEVEIVQKRRVIDKDWDHYFLYNFHAAVADDMGISNGIYWELINSTKYLDWVNYRYTFGGWLRKSDNKAVITY